MSTDISQDRPFTVPSGMAPLEEILLKKPAVVDQTEPKKTRRVKEKEADPHRLSQRQKQINFGTHVLRLKTLDWLLLCSFLMQPR